MDKRFHLSLFASGLWNVVQIHGPHILNITSSATSAGPETTYPYSHNLYPSTSCTTTVKKERKKERKQYFSSRKNLLFTFIKSQSFSANHTPQPGNRKVLGEKYSQSIQVKLPAQAVNQNRLSCLLKQHLASLVL